MEYLPTQFQEIPRYFSPCSLNHIDVIHRNKNNAGLENAIDAKKCYSVYIGACIIHHAGVAKMSLDYLGSVANMDASYAEE